MNIDAPEGAGAYLRRRLLLGVRLGPLVLHASAHHGATPACMQVRTYGAAYCSESDSGLSSAAYWFQFLNVRWRARPCACWAAACAVRTPGGGCVRLPCLHATPSSQQPHHHSNPIITATPSSQQPHHHSNPIITATPSSQQPHYHSNPIITATPSSQQPHHHSNPIITATPSSQQPHHHSKSPWVTAAHLLHLPHLHASAHHDATPACMQVLIFFIFLIRIRRMQRTAAVRFDRALWTAGDCAPTHTDDH